MRNRLLFFLCFLALQFLTPSFAANLGKKIRLQALKYERMDSLERASILYDSAFHQYLKQRHFASAALAFQPFEKILREQGLEDSAHYYLRIIYDSSRQVKKYRRNSFVLWANHNLAGYYGKRKLIDSLSGVIDNCLRPSIRKFGLRSNRNFEVYELKSSLSYYEGKLDSASYWLHQSLKANDLDSIDPELWIYLLEIDHLAENEEALENFLQQASDFPEKDATYLMYKSLQTYAQGDLGKAVKDFKAIKYTPDSSTNPIVDLKYQYISSLFYYELGEYDESLDISLSNYDLIKGKYPESQPLSADYHEQIFRVYFAKSDFGAARQYIEELILAMEDQLVDHHPLKARAYFEYSRLLTALENYDLALVQIDSALSISDPHTQENRIFYGRSLNQKGVVEYFLNNLDSAEQYLLKSYSVLDENISNKQHIYFAQVFNDLGRVYQNKEIDDHSIRDYIRSLRIYRKLLGKVHPHLGQGYYNVGTLYARNQNFLEALKFYQLSLTSNIFDFNNEDFNSNPSINNALSDYNLLKALTAKAEALEKQYNISKDPGQLGLALETYKLISNLIDKLRTGYVSAESKKFLSQKTSSIYERAIQLCLHLAEINNDPKIKETAFFFSEKSRAGILLSSIKDANAKKISGVPDSLLALEKTMLENISNKELELFEEMNKGARARNQLVESLKSDLFGLRNSYHNHVLFLEENFPRYFQLKYDPYSASVEDIQLKLLTPKSKKDKKNYQLLEYFIGRDSLYIFQIQKNNYNVLTRKKPENFEKIITGYRNSMIFNVEGGFTEKSQLLSDLLIPIELEKKTHLMIVPDGVLSYLPFESLIRNAKEKELNKQDFLFKKTTISYSYSATLSVEISNTPYYHDRENQSFAGFAPVFENMSQEMVLSSNAEMQMNNGNMEQKEDDFKSNFKALPGAREELENIYKKTKARKFDSNAYFYASANKENLNNGNSLNSRFLHFATHGVLDERNPNFSGILLSGSKEEDLLSLGEIYGLSTKSELVTLSACETGMGELLGGEGLISYSRGFFYAGSRFIIVSLWKVSDESSSEFMRCFYQGYAKRKRKDIYKCFQKSRKKVQKKKDYNYLSDWFPFVLVGMH